MENKINIAEILKDCPIGTKLFSSIYGEVKLARIFDDGDNFPIAVENAMGETRSFTKEGRINLRYPKAECLLFPSSGMRDWTKFFKRGDVVITNGGGMTAIFDGWANDTYTEFNTTINLYFNGNTGKEEVGDTLQFRKATEEERKQFIEKAERAFNGKYNPETLQVEPVKPKCPFKPFGEKIKIKLEEIKELIEEYENEV